MSFIAVAVETMTHAGEAVHAAESAGHAAAPASATPEIPNFLTLVIHGTQGSDLSHFLHRFENGIFAVFTAILISVVFSIGIRKREMIPGIFQSMLEMIAEALDNLVTGVIGKKYGREYTPLVGSLFLYIWVMNLSGLVPGLKSPTSSINTTVGLAISVFIFVQYTALKRLGFLGTLHHLAGSPQDKIGWIFAPLMFPLHVLGELIKPLSLALRLFGNIMGEDALLASFLGIGILLSAFVGSPIGVPLQFPIMLLALITGTIQALVFSLLTTIYISMVMPHESHAHEEGEHGEHH